MPTLKELLDSEIPNWPQGLVRQHELSQNIDQNRAQVSLGRAQDHLKNPAMNIQRAEQAIKRAKNRLTIYKKYHN